MLRRLIIRDFLLIRTLDLEFESGLVAITGETGTGKSMLAGALDVVLGEKPPRDPVRQGAARAIIEAEFRVDAAQLPPELAEDYDAESGELTIRRELPRQGRMRAWLNDRPISQDILILLRHRLADFHGQHEHQELFAPTRQLAYLDAMAGTTDLAAGVASLRRERSALAKRLAETDAALEAHRKERVLLEYQLDEIERLGLSAGEEDQVELRLSKLESTERLELETARLLEVLAEAEPSVVGLTGQARTTAASITRLDRGFQTLSEELADLQLRAKDLANEVRRYRDSLTFDEEELARLRERRSVIWELKRKHALSVEQILERAAQMKTMLAEGEALANKRQQLADELKLLDSQLLEQAHRLSELRHEASGRLQQSVKAKLLPLGFTYADFQVRIETKPEPVTGEDVTGDGLDRIEFLFTANPDSPPAPLRDVASGGESSRVTLAIRSVLSETARYPLLVYDEIDTGISGRVADQVGRALSELAHGHQVLVITHLAQIASRAERQLEVRKDINGAETEITVRYLSGDERVRAIAGLMAGEKVTEKALATAGELLQQTGKS